MQAYKIYFNGERFILEDKLSNVEDYVLDSTIMYNSSIDTGLEEVELLNRNYKPTSKDVTRMSEFTIKKCKKCDQYFTLTCRQISWFEKRNLSLPNTCSTCRKNNNNKK